jgi:hypothetical protein
MQVVYSWKPDHVALITLLIAALLVVPGGLLIVKREEGAALRRVDSHLHTIEVEQLDRLKSLLNLRPQVEAVRSSLEELRAIAASLEAQAERVAQAASVPEGMGPGLARLAAVDPQLAELSPWEKKREAGGGEFQGASGMIKGPNPKELEEAIGSTLAREVQEVQANMNTELKKLYEEGVEASKEIDAIKVGRDNPFYVKWHSKDGLKSSDRLPTETEAAILFEKVGDFAKKLLMFDGSRWSCIKEFGGDNWLNLMQDNGDPQTGEHKPK